MLTWLGPKLALSFSIRSSKDISSFFSSFLISFFKTKPGGKACRYIHFCPLGHSQNHPYFDFSTASRKCLQILKKMIANNIC